MDFFLVLVGHDDVIKWKHFPRNWPFVRGIHRSPVNSPHKGQWRGALMFTLICAGINGWVNTREAGDLRRYRPHYDVIVMCLMYGHGCYGDANQNLKILINSDLATSRFRKIFQNGVLGAVSIRKTVLPGMAIPMLKIRRPNGRLIFNMEIAIRR